MDEEQIPFTAGWGVYIPLSLMLILKGGVIPLHPESYKSCPSRLNQTRDQFSRTKINIKDPVPPDPGK